MDFLHLSTVPSGTTYTSDFVVQTLIPELESAIRTTRPIIGLSGTKLHWDNARPHTSKLTTDTLAAKGLTILQHPPYSPDLAPCDFFLFGHIKQSLMGRQFESSDEIVSAITVIFSGFGNERLYGVMEEWKNRLRTVIENHGEYYIK